MSTKIYNGFLIECVDYNQLFEIIQDMKKYCNETLYNEYFQQLIEFKVEIEDMQYLKKENPELHWELEGVFYEDILSKDLLQQNEINKLPHKNFQESFDNEIIVFESFVKPHFDQNTIFPEHINNQGTKCVPVIIFGKEAFAYAEKHFKDFHYQDQTDRPEEISETDWLFREKAWQNRLKTGIPSVDGLEIKLSDEFSVNRLHLMNMMQHGIKTAMEKYKNEHPLEERIQKYLRKKEGKKLMNANDLLKTVTNERKKKPLLAKDIATEKQKWAVNLCAEFTSAKKFNWKRGTVEDMQKYLNEYYTIAKNNYDYHMEDYGLTHDDF